MYHYDFQLYCKLDLSLYYILYYNIIYNIYIILPFSSLTQIMKTQMVQWYNGTIQDVWSDELWISDNKASLLEIETGRDAPDR